MIESTALRTAPARGLSAMRLVWLLAGLLCMAFGLMAVEFTLAVRADRAGTWATIQALLTGEAYTLGTGSAHAMYPVYRRALAAMTTHTMLGGLALLLGALQFVPSLRRRHPLLHRATGAGVLLAVAASMAGSLTYLASTPLDDIYASPAFGLGLWALALACLAWLALAVVAVRQRDYRSHMGFMALMMSTLLTAPVLRFEWALFGMVVPHDMATVNQGVTSSLALVTTLIMMFWMAQVGDTDLPRRARHAVVPPGLVQALAWTAIAVLLHEGILAPLGFDLLTGWRAEVARLPLVAALWTLPAMGLAFRVPREIAQVLAGGTVSGLTRLLALTSAAGALPLAVFGPRDVIDAVALGYFWPAYALALGGLVWLGQRSRTPEPWTLTWLFLGLLPATFPPAIAVAWLCGQDYAVGLWLGCTVGSALMATNAFLTAFAIRLPWTPRQTSAVAVS